MKPKLREGTDYIIRRGRMSDLAAYLGASQRSAEKAYSSAAVDNLKLFSEHHYFHPSMMDYWRQMAANTSVNHWWVAEIQKPVRTIAGGICLSELHGRLEGRGFYIAPEWQGKGIGRRLWETRRQYINRPLYFEVYSHAKRTIDFHTRNGAVPTGRSRAIHWESWPEKTYLTAMEFVQE